MDEAGRWALGVFNLEGLWMAMGAALAGSGLASAAGPGTDMKRRTSGALRSACRRSPTNGLHLAAILAHKSAVQKQVEAPSTTDEGDQTNVAERSHL